MRLDADVRTDPAKSPFGHTYISLTREGIEQREVAA
jgi:fumarate reductase (CoM/CoB) subunit A